MLKSDFKTLFAWKATLYTIVIMIIIGMFSPLVNILNDDSTLGGFFEFSYVVLMISSVISGLFMYRDYSQNTIRNKIVVGNSRTSIYFSKSITICFFMFLSMIIFLAVSVVIGFLFGDISYIKYDVFVNNCAVILVSTMVVSSLVSLLSICIPSPIGAMLPLMLLGSTMFISMISFEMFLINENTTMIEIFKIVPVLNLLTINEITPPFDLTGTFLYGSIMILILQHIGLYIFKKMNLK